MNHEALWLQWKDIDGDSLTVRPKPGYQPKTYTVRTVFLSPVLVGMLSEYRRTRKFRSDDSWVFTSRKSKKRLAWIAGALRETFKSAGCYTRSTVLHGLRHGAASEMLRNGTDLRTLMSLMGWSNLATAEKYLHTDEETKREAANRSLL